MKLRLWPKSLIGQLVFAVAVILFVAQAINFVLLSRGQRQQTLAHGGGMAVARIIDAMDREQRGVASVRTDEEEGDRRDGHRGAPKLWIDDKLADQAARPQADLHVEGPSRLTSQASV